MDKVNWKFKKDVEPQEISDFWYDLTSGGYINLDKIIDDKDQLNDAKRAVNLIWGLELELRDRNLLIDL